MFKCISIRNKLFILPLLLAIAMLGELSLVITSLQQNHDDALILNIAGRQRMLIKKFSAEELYKSDANNQHFPSVLNADKTAELFEISLKALQHGGPSYQDLSMTKKNYTPRPLPF